MGATGRTEGVSGAGGLGNAIVELASARDASQREDFSPDFFYDTAARIADFGWTAEMRVPFASLRYPKQEEQAWRILIWRNWPREYRYFIHSRPLPRGSDCLVCHAQPMTGIRGLPSAGGFVLAPYATGQDVAEEWDGRRLSGHGLEVPGGVPGGLLMQGSGVVPLVRSQAGRGARGVSER